MPDQEVEGRPEIVGYIPDDDSDSADGIFRDGCCRPEYKARGSVFHAIAGIQAAENPGLRD